MKKTYYKLFIFIFCLTPLVATSKIPDDYAKIITDTHKNTIPYNQCQEMENKIGQLMYITADGFGSNYTIHPDYDRLIKRIQPGGVLPHYNSSNINKIRRANEVLQNNSLLPLMIGIDYQSVKADGKEIRIGLGFGSGLVGTVGEQSPECYEKIATLDAVLHKYAGINHPLGPTIEYDNNGGGILEKDLFFKKPRLDSIISAFKNMGLETTIKHFPHTPEGYNLHKESKDTKIPKDEIDTKYMPIFKELSQESGFLMTTHLYNSEIDPANMATFSKKWMNKLRNEVGFKGIVMTDALFMISQYSTTMKNMARDWPLSDPDDDTTIFSIKAILAGHDMFFVETAASDTEKLWKNLVKFSCTNNNLADTFRKRIKESYDRIVEYKNANQQLRNISTPLTAKEITTLINARSDIPGICAKDFSQVALITNQLSSTPTKIADNIFPCAQFIFDENSSLIKQILMLQNTTEKTVLPEMVIQAATSSNPDEINFAIKMVTDNKDLRNQVREMAKTKVNIDNFNDQSDALTTLTVLDLFDQDSIIIDQLFTTKQDKLIKKYIELGKKGSLPSISGASRKEAQEYLLSTISKNPINLEKMKAFSVEMDQLIEIIFPYEVLSNLTIKEIEKMDIPIDLKIILFIKRNYNPDFEEIHDQEILQRIFAIYFNNPHFHNLNITNTTCVNKINNHCLQQLQTKTQPWMILNALLYDKSSFKNLNEKTRQFANLLIDKKIKENTKIKEIEYIVSKDEIRFIQARIYPNEQKINDFIGLNIKSFKESLKSSSENDDNFWDSSAMIGNGISLLTFEKMNLSEANKQFISDVLKKEWSGDIELPFEIQEYVKNNKEIFPEEKFRSIISVE
ncbi:MAG: hypothetical protein A2577_12800 [Bdellovibrionales bacterium RIFOXYD1_FULL_36_51]|nr:MAG: hypothetical protein A2577_12800 [Bdellovibrionales bacterium RIFOXYD1_FULL_36_51]